MMDITGIAAFDYFFTFYAFFTIGLMPIFAGASFFRS